MDDFKQRFDKLLIDKLGVSEEDLKPDVKFIDDLGADSLDMTELIVELEKAFGIIIYDEDVEKIITIGNAEQYLKSRLHLNNIGWL